MRLLDLFSGIGGFSLAARWCNWNTVQFVEIDPFCQKVLSKNFPGIPIHGDIKTFDGTKLRGSVDIVCGGFPCQPFSTAGKRKGTEDDRHLWPEMLRVIREVKPRFIVGENVFGLVNWSKGLVFEQAHVDLEAQGYEVQSYILPACSKNAPHRRDRVWIVAHAKSDTRNNEFRDERHRAHKVQDERPIKSVITPNASSLGRLHTEQIRELGGIRLSINDIGDTWEKFPTQSPICMRNDGLPYGLVDISFSKWRRESIKALGNAIVPQVAYEIFKAIEQVGQV